jgi:TP901 family phage tail tape measure protein
MATEIGRGVIPVGLDDSRLNRDLSRVGANVNSHFDKVGRQAGGVGGRQFGSEFSRNSSGALRGSTRAIEADADDTGRRAGRRMGGSFSGAVGGLAARAGGALGVTVGVAAVGGFVKQAVTLEAEFGKTMNLIQATTGLPAAGMRSLSDLALKMGRDTVFSASDASAAMLELARGGMTAATIKGGALQGTLTLAAAGGLDMATAANVAVKAMGAFNLQGRDMDSVAAALAGAANASAASVGDLSIALSQTGLAANAVGFSVQETTGILAAFSNAGLNGSDAGTSLKTMLSSLTPSTKSATEAFRTLGIITEDGRNRFINANGTYKSAAQIAEILRQGTVKLTDAQRNQAIRQGFGSDAQRAANILANEGARGINRMVKATSDQGAAQRTAQAAMKGTAGAIESLKGSLETATLRFGQLIQPAVIGGLRLATRAINGIEPAIGRVASAFRSGEASTGQYGAIIRNTGRAIGDFVASVLPTLRRVGREIAGTVGPALRDIGRMVMTDLLPAFQRVLPIIAPVARFIIRVIGGAIVGAIKGAVQVIKGIVNVIAGVFKLVSALVRGEWGGAWRALVQIMKGVLQIVVGAIRVWFNVGILGIFKGGVVRLLTSWRGLWTGARQVGSRAMALLGRIIDAGFRAVGAIFRGAARIIGGIFRGMFTLLGRLATAGWRVVSGIFTRSFTAVRGIVTRGVTAVTGFFRGLFTAIGRRTSDGWRNLTGLFRRGLETVRTVTRQVLDKVTGIFAGAWRSIKATGDRLRGLLTGTLPRAFRSGRDAIGRIWDGLKGVAKRPVQFIVNTVYMKGIYRVVAALPGKNPLPPLHFKRGGPVPEHLGTKGKDSVPALLMPNEHVLTAREVAKAGGHKVIEAWRRRIIGGSGYHLKEARAERLAAGGPVQRFWLGGGVKPAAGSVNRHGDYSFARWAGDINEPGSVDIGHPVRAWKAGTVSFAGWGGGDSYGNYMKVNHGDVTTYYAHLSAFGKRPGTRVRAGERIGSKGGTGNASGPHLHFEIRGGGSAIQRGSKGARGGIDSGNDGGAIRTRVNTYDGMSIADAVSRLNPAKWVAGVRRFGDWGRLMAGVPKTMAGQAVSYAKRTITRAIAKAWKWVTSHVGGAFGGGAGKTLNQVTGRLVPAMRAAYKFAQQTLGIRNIGGYSYRPNTANPSQLSDHAYGKALDLMGAKQNVADYFAFGPGRRRFNIENVIYNRRITNPGRGWKWGYYSGPNPHTDHVHIDTFDRGGLARGIGVLPKRTIKPERMLDPRTTVAFERLVDGLTRAPTAAAAGGTARAAGAAALTITNWEEGRGYIRFLAADEVGADREFQAARGRAR